MAGNVVTVEINNTPVQLEVQAAGDRETAVTMRTPSFDGVVKSIKEISGELTKALSELKPDRATLEFGVDVGIEAGQLTALLVKGSGSATLRITLEWGRAG
jgi:hypothetical protein